MNTVRTESPGTSKSEATCSRDRDMNRAFRIGGAGISGASAGALMGSFVGGPPGAVAGALVVAATNMALNFYNERDDSGNDRAL